MDFGLFALSFSGAVDAATLIGALAVICLTLSAMQWCIAMLRNYAAGGVSRFHRPGSALHRPPNHVNKTRMKL